MMCIVIGVHNLVCVFQSMFGTVVVNLAVICMRPPCFQKQFAGECVQRPHTCWLYDPYHKMQLHMCIRVYSMQRYHTSTYAAGRTVHWPSKHRHATASKALRPNMEKKSPCVCNVICVWCRLYVIMTGHTLSLCSPTPAMFNHIYCDT